MRLQKDRYRVFIKYCVFFRIFQNIPNSVFPRCQFVYTKQAGRKPALLQNWRSSEKSQNFKEKTQYLMNTLYIDESFEIEFQKISEKKVHLSGKKD